MRVALHVSPFSIGRGASRTGAAREDGAGRAKQARRAERARQANPVHTYTGTVAGQELGCVLVRVTSGARGADRTLIGATITVRTHLSFPVWSAVEVRLRAADQSLVSIDPVS